MRMIISAIALLAICALASFTAAQEPAQTPEPSDNERGVKAYEAKDFEAAIGWFERAHQAAPDNPSIQGNLARALHAQTQVQIAAGQLTEATLALERAIRLDATEPLFDVRLSEVWRRRDDWPAARSVLEAALKRHPESAKLYEAYADLEYADERLDVALQHLDRAIAFEDPVPGRRRTLREKILREMELEQGWFRDQRGAVVVKYDDAAFQAISTTILDVVDRAHLEVARALQHRPMHRVSVILYSRREFQAATGTHAWAGGLFDGKIRVPVQNFHAMRERIEQTIRHELVHWFLRDLCPKCPLWLNEGLAQLFEGRPLTPREVALLRSLRDSAALPSVQKLPPSWVGIADANRVAALYAQSFSMTLFLQQKLPGAQWGDFLRQLQRGLPIAQAVLEATGASLEAIEAEWRMSL